MKKLSIKEIKIGVSALVALAILVFGIDFLKGINVFKATNYFYVTFDNVTGLATSAPVTLNGFKVGQVREMDYDYDHPGKVKVEIALDKDLKLPNNTTAVLSSDILGTASIVLHLGQTAGYMNIGDTIDGVVQPGMLDAVSENLMPSVAQIFPKIDTLLTTLNTLAADPALRAAVGRLDGITADLRSTTMQINTIAQELGTLPSQLNTVMGDAHQITGNVKGMTSNLETITYDVQKLTGQLKDLPVDSLIDNIQTTTTNLRILSQQMNDPNSSLGLLMRDPALYNNINATVSSLDSLLIDVKKNPKRYINIKVF